MNDQPTESEWMVETNTGKNEMKRIMCGYQKVIGWTMKPYSESFQKIADAHNAQIATERELKEKAIEAWGKRNLKLAEQLTKRNAYDESDDKRYAGKGDGKMSDQPKPTNSDHLLSYTPFGLVQYPDGSKAVMAWNKAEAKRLVEWHNAAVKEAYEKGKQDGVREHYVGK